jgi:type I restriction enzyme S subunit
LLVDHLPGPATLNSGVFVIRPKDTAYDPRFFYYVLTSRIFDDFLTRLQAGSTISHLYQKDFVSFSFLAPATLAEQTTIATVLSDMDAELAALEQRRDKTRALKQAMMQELLTGKTRLVPAGGAHA